MKRIFHILKLVKYMVKKFFSFLILMIISGISFLVTSKAVDYIKQLDPIMTDIKNNKNLYEVASIDAEVDNISVTPGISGTKIDFNSSYKNMKKYGGYDDNLLVFNKELPTVSVTNIYDKYITSGNKKLNRVSLIFKITNTNYLEEIIYILKEKEVIGTFFISDDVLKNNPDIIKLLYLNNQKIETLGNQSKYSALELDQINHLLRSYISKGISYCYSDDINNDVLSVCRNKKMHTIIPTINTDKFPYYEIKNNLNNGDIIKFNNNIRTVEELSYIINYIRQNNINIVSLEKMLEE